MNASFPFLALLAQSGFDLSSQQDPANLAGFVVVLLLLAAFAAGLLLVKRYVSWKERPAARNQSALFRELCRAHHLPWRERRLLRRLSRASGAAPESRLFVEPDLFEAGAEAPALSSSRSAIAALKSRLFDR